VLANKRRCHLYLWLDSRAVNSPGVISAFQWAARVHRVKRHLEDWWINGHQLGNVFLYKIEHSMQGEHDFWPFLVDDVICFSWRRVPKTTSAARDLLDNYFLPIALHSVAHFLHAAAHFYSNHVWKFPHSEAQALQISAHSLQSASENVESLAANLAHKTQISHSHVTVKYILNGSYRSC